MKLILLLYLLLLNLNLFCQELYPALPFGNNTYDVFKIKVEKENLNNFSIIKNENNLSHQDFVTTLSDTFYFAINASISDSFCNPIGYYVNEYSDIQPVNLSDGVGNFFLKPNGALLIMSDSAIICESSEISRHSGIRLGIQSGPMLLVNENVNSQFSANSKNENIRCGVGIYSSSNNDQFLIFCISNEPVSFYNFAMFFKQKFKCQNALCLESMGCVMNLPDTDSITWRQFEGVICNYIYYSIK